jgi:hypothetical protein
VARVDTAAARPDTAAALADTSRPRLIVEAWAAALDFPDTLAAPTDTLHFYQAQPDTLGKYEIRNLSPGLYKVQAFLDWDRDRRYDAGEPASATADSVRVVPLEKTGGVDLIVRPARGR